MNLRLPSLVIVACWPAMFGVQAAELYVSTAGNDTLPGTIEQPFRTIQHAADAAKPGDTVLIRGGVYRERVFIRDSGQPGRPITYRRFGEEDVQIWFSKDVSAAEDWIEMGANRWRTADGSFALSVNHDVATIWHDDRSNWRYKKRRPEDLQTQWDFWHNLEQGRIEVYSEGNPASKAKHIEVPLDPPDSNQFVVTVSASHIVMDGISIKYANVHGIQVKGDYVTFRNGRITHGGGGNISPNRKPPVRWGDGLDIWGSAHDVVFENNVVGEFPDGGLTNQGFRGVQYNIFFRNNLIYNCTNGIHCWFGQNEADKNELHHIYYQGNTFRDIGRGWFEDQGVMQGAIQFNPRKGVATSEIHIRGNTFINCGTTRFTGGTWQGVNGAINIGGGDVHIANNRIYGGPSEGMHIHHNGQPWTGSIVNNLIYNNGWSGLRIYRNATTGKARLCNNTIVNNGDAEHPNVSAENSAGTMLWRNNIFCSTRSQPLRCKAGDFDFNCIWPGTAKGPHSISADPRFVNPKDNDYRLSPGSPCLDAGDRSAAPPADLEGRRRPAGRGADVGAYEGDLSHKEAEVKTGWRTRLQACWSLFSGSCGHINGTTGIWDLGTRNSRSYEDGLRSEGRTDLQWVRKLIESQPLDSCVPHRSLIVGDAGEPDRDKDCLCATRGDLARTEEKRVNVRNGRLTIRIRLRDGRTPAGLRNLVFRKTP